MARLLVNARFATVVAVAASLFVAGAVAGAAGGALILGAFNTADASATTVTSSSPMRTLLVGNTVAGHAIQGSAKNGIGGFFQSQTSTGMAGFTTPAHRFAVVGTHNTGARGTGAAVLGDGGLNDGVVGTSEAFGDGVGVHGLGMHPDGNVGVVGESLGTMSGNPTGVMGISNSIAGYGVWGIQNDPGGAAGRFDGDVEVNGMITAPSCACSTTFALAQNAGPALAQGDPVTLAGATLAPDGTPIPLIRRAAPGEAVFGLADRSLAMPALETSRWSRGGHQLRVGELGAAADGLLRVVTSGTLVLEQPASGLAASAAGARLVAGEAGLAASAAENAAAIGWVGGSLDDGRLLIVFER